MNAMHGDYSEMAGKWLTLKAPRKTASENVVC